MELPSYIKCLIPTQGLPALIGDIFPGIEQVGNQSLDAQSDYFGGRAILAAQNDPVDAVNSVVLNLLPGNEHSLKSADYVIRKERTWQKVWDSHKSI